MALKTNSSPVQENEPLIISALEQSVEGEYNLPDYKPEIQKILKCIPKAVIMQRIAVGGKATVDGYVLATVLYLTTDSDAVYGISYKLPFSRQIDLKKPVSDGALISVFAGIQYFNCRVINKRKIDCRGAVNLFVNVRGYDSVELLSDAEGERCQQRVFDTAYKSIALQSERQFTIDEQLLIEAKGHAEVLRIDTDAVNARIYASESKLSVEGDINIRLAVCYPENMEIKTYDYKLPFTRELNTDFDEASAAEFFAQVQVISQSVQPSAEDETMADASFTCVASVYAIKETTVQLIKDIYSTEYGCEIAIKPITLLNGIEAFDKQFTALVEFAQQISSAQKIDCFAYPLRAFVKEDGLLIAVFDAVCIVKDKNGDSYAISQEIETTISGEIGKEPLWMNVIVDTAAFEIDGTLIRGKIGGRLSGAYADYRRVEAVEKAVIDEKDKKQKRDFALTIYFAEENENVWDIAKRYNTAADEIIAHNKLSSETVTERRMLLIPIVD